MSLLKSDYRILIVIKFGLLNLNLSWGKKNLRIFQLTMLKLNFKITIWSLIYPAVVHTLY